ncbi:toll/interleukin-1 receptor domain-containing protein, partial [bacterium]|nr:toll/interleukin-1 receptor domain-containing protein [bacterium]
SQALENMALKAASHFDGISYVNPREMVSSEKAVYFSDGTDFDHFEKWKTYIKAQNYYLVLLNGVSMAPKSLEAWQSVSLQEEHPMLELQGVFQGKEKASPIDTQVRKLFISHSVKDENILSPVIDYLRKHFHLELFLCADSLQEGAPWFEEIEVQLAECDDFILINSALAKSSVFCAFEAGMAKALKKNISIISLDGSAPSAYFQHLHMYDQPRLLQQKPWLTQKEVLIDIFYKILA